MAALGGHWMKGAGGGRVFVAAAKQQDMWAMFPEMSDAERAAAAKGNWAIPDWSATPAGQRIVASGGSLSSEGRAMSEVQRIAGARIAQVRQTAAQIPRLESSARRNAARRLAAARNNIERIRQSVGGSSVQEAALVRAIRQRYITETR